MKWWMLVVVTSACIDDELVPCGELACPLGNVCTPGGCADPGDVDACAGVPDGAACTSPRAPHGACHGGGCRAIVCGDAVVDHGEACDDGNTASGDGCSPTCASNETCGNDVVDLAEGETCDSGVAGLSNDGCSSRCRVETPAWRDVSPQAIAARVAPLVAYDTIRNVVVLFGGYGAHGNFGDTWTWDGASWIEMHPVQAPSPREGAAIAFDQARGRAVLFGGADAQSLLSDTWTWDGSEWTEQHPTHAPPVTYTGLMTYDDVREVVVLFRGNAGGDDTWEWDGADWTQRFTSMSPAQRIGAAMAYDSAHHVTMLYGGMGNPGDTWTYDGVDWTDHATGTGPPDYGTTIAFDANSNAVIAFGGDLNIDTWQWDGNAWGVVQNGGVSARRFTAMVFDAAQSSVILFGGVDLQEDPLADTWRYDGLSWQQILVTAIAPSPRGGAGIAYDEARGEIVLFGGNDGPSNNETWIWSRGAWHKATPAMAPSSRTEPLMAYDRVHHQVVLFGGRGLRDMWTWNGTTWAPVSFATVPPGRSNGGMVFDDALGRLVMYGGTTGISNLHDTWTWTGTDWMQIPTHHAPDVYAFGMTYDAARARIVLFGGFSTIIGIEPVTDRTWEFDGTDWIDVSPARSSPPGRANPAMYYDPITRHTILMGGDASPIHSDTWEWDGTTWTRRDDVPGTQLAGAAIVYDRVERRGVLFGGFGNIKAVDLTLAFQYIDPLAIGERCLRADLDDDGDGLAGCADPDCWGRCSPECAPGTTCATNAIRCGDGICQPVEDAAICPSDC